MDQLNNKVDDLSAKKNPEEIEYDIDSMLKDNQEAGLIPDSKKEANDRAELLRS